MLNLFYSVLTVCMTGITPKSLEKKSIENFFLVPIEPTDRPTGCSGLTVRYPLAAIYRWLISMMDRAQLPCLPFVSRLSLIRRLGIVRFKFLGFKKSHDRTELGVKR